MGSVLCSSIHEKSLLWFSHPSFSRLLVRFFQPLLVFIVILSPLSNGSGPVCSQSYQYLFLITVQVFSARFLFVTNTQSESVFLPSSHYCFHGYCLPSGISYRLCQLMSELNILWPGSFRYSVCGGFHE